MSSYLIELVKNRRCRYVFASRLWDKDANRFSAPVNVMLDTGAFNTLIHEALVPGRATMTKNTAMTSIGSYRGEARVCILHKMKIGEYIMEEVVALAVPFEGELREHILLGTNVTNNWKFTVSRMDDTMEIAPHPLQETMGLKTPYRYYFNNKGKIIAFQDIAENSL